MTSRSSASEAALRSRERAQLEAFLDDNREELIGAVEGLTDEQARRRLVPSLTTPLALLKHAVFVEKVWFQVALAGRTREEIGLPHDIDESFMPSAHDSVDSLVKEFRTTAEESRRIAAPLELDDLALHNRRGPLTLRWIYVHMVEELARHAGHADILREQIMAADEDS